jgi:hypothetical protein
MLMISLDDTSPWRRAGRGEERRGKGEEEEEERRRREGRGDQGRGKGEEEERGVLFEALQPRDSTYKTY